MITLATARLRNRRDDLWAMAGSIAGLAASENRAFTAAEQQEWDQAIRQLDYVDARLRGALAAEAGKTEGPPAGAKVCAFPPGRALFARS